jgi:hypothetical protein
VKALLVLLLAVPAAAQPSHLEDQGFAPQLVEVKGPVTVDGSASTQPVSGPFLTDGQLRATPVAVSGTVSVGNALLVTTVTAAVPIQRTQAVLGRYYFVNSGHLTSGTGQTPLLLFVNLSTNTVTAYWDSVDFESLELNIAAHFHVYRAPVVTSSGTAVGIRAGLSTSAPSKMQAYLSPTVSSIGNIEFMSTAVGTTVPMRIYQAFIIQPGEKALVTVANSSNNRQTTVTVWWAEE